MDGRALLRIVIAVSVLGLATSVVFMLLFR
jgi:hypothetical protein